MFIIDMKIFILLIAMHNCYFAFDYLPVAHWQIYCILKTKSLFFYWLCAWICVCPFMYENWLKGFSLQPLCDVYTWEILTNIISLQWFPALPSMLMIMSLQWFKALQFYVNQYVFTVAHRIPICVNDYMYIFIIIHSTPICVNNFILKCTTCRPTLIYCQP